MWVCSNCGREFERSGQMHSCRSVPFEEHFENKEKARKLFDRLSEKIDREVGECRTISLPCCVHLFGKYDFLAALPKKDKLEIRFALDRKLDSPRLKQAVSLSAKSYKNCFDISREGELDEEFMKWIKESYHMKDGD